jgi:hypothetical protein
MPVPFAEARWVLTPTLCKWWCLPAIRTCGPVPLEDQRTNPLVKKTLVYTGHHNGVITLHVVEADDAHRVTAREQMNERYRTVLGHMRHESGHYYWDKLVQGSACYPRFRSLFGGEENYREALDYYYAYGPVANWQKRHISAYASAHPWEDWAETWAHYLHIMDTLETATGFGLIHRDTASSSEASRVMKRSSTGLPYLLSPICR